MTLLNNIKSSLPLSFVNILPIARLEPFLGHRVILLLTKTVLVTLKKNQFIIVPKVSSYKPLGSYVNNNEIKYNVEIYRKLLTLSVRVNVYPISQLGRTPPSSAKSDLVPYEQSYP